MTVLKQGVPKKYIGQCATCTSIMAAEPSEILLDDDLGEAYIPVCPVCGKKYITVYREDEIEAKEMLECANS